MHRPLAAPGLAAAVAMSLALAAPPADAQCSRSCAPEKRDASGCCPAAAPAPTPGAKPAQPAAPKCPEGQLVSVDTANHCCWPGQAWAGRCVGMPTSCPKNHAADAASQSCKPIPCTGGTEPAPNDKGQCCYPGQAWSGSRGRCIGLPKRCPAGTSATGETCAPTDTDGDGIPDANDKCPKEPETKNGYRDDDGCPDTPPPPPPAAAPTPPPAPPPQKPQGACTDDGQCGDGEVCSQGVCRAPGAPPPAAATGGCRGPADCNGFACIEGVCTASSSGAPQAAFYGPDGAPPPAALPPGAERPRRSKGMMAAGITLFSVGMAGTLAGAALTATLTTGGSSYSYYSSSSKKVSPVGPMVMGVSAAIWIPGAILWGVGAKRVDPAPGAVPAVSLGPTGGSATWVF